MSIPVAMTHEDRDAAKIYPDPYPIDQMRHDDDDRVVRLRNPRTTTSTTTRERLLPLRSEDIGIEPGEPFYNVCTQTLNPYIYMPYFL